LARLAADAASRGRVLRQTRALAEGADARFLRAVLRGRQLDLERAAESDRPAVLQVAEWTDGLFRNAPSPHAARGLLARAALREGFGVLVRRFRGREDQLETLRRFVSAPPPRDGRPPTMGVSGIGGAGKSALLARFADRLLALPARRRPAVVVIDFDRARF